MCSASRSTAGARQALDDSLIALFEAKYHYHFWRPITAVRNGELDGNAATEPDVAWTPYHDAPMHPEYPSGHAILAGALAEVLEADLAGGIHFRSAVEIGAGMGRQIGALAAEKYLAP